MFLLQGNTTKIAQVIDTSGITIINIRSYKEEIYQIDESHYQDIFPQWVTDIIVPTSFSISELVYATIT